MTLRSNGVSSCDCFEKFYEYLIRGVLDFLYINYIEIFYNEF